MLEPAPPPSTTSLAVFEVLTARAAVTTSPITSLPSAPPPRKTVPPTVEGDAGADHGPPLGVGGTEPLWVNTREVRS